MFVCSFNGVAQKLTNTNTGVQSINNVYANVNKVEIVLKSSHIFDLIDIGVYVVYALYSRILLFKHSKKC